MAYANGRVPFDKLEKYNGDWFFPGTLKRWKNLVARVRKSHGVTLTVSPRANGAGNAYRPYDEQVSSRNALGVMSAVPGTSSHGGLWSGQTTGAGGLPSWVSNVESGAIDVWNWASIPWADFKAAAEAEGFIVNAVVPEERWHIIDLDPWGHKIKGKDTDVMNARQEKKLDDALKYAKAAHAASVWNKRRLGGSNLKGENITQIISWLKLRHGGSYKGPTLEQRLARIEKALADLKENK